MFRRAAAYTFMALGAPSCFAVLWVMSLTDREKKSIGEVIFHVATAPIALLGVATYPIFLFGVCLYK